MSMLRTEYKEYKINKHFLIGIRSRRGIAFYFITENGDYGIGFFKWGFSYKWGWNNPHYYFN